MKKQAPPNPKIMISNISMICNPLIFQYQLDYGDYITIYNITDDGKSTVIDILSYLDNGPLFYYDHHENWQKKIISSTSNKMLVVFRSDDLDETFEEYFGFSTSIHYSPLPSKECEAGLDMNMKTIQSPNYPDSYDNNLSCKWLISVPHGSHITLKFLQLHVGLFGNFNI